MRVRNAVARLVRWKPAAWAVSLVIVCFVFLCAVALRHSGLVQFLEFYGYDLLTRHQPKALSSDPLVLVEMTEADIHSPDLDYPLYDNKLAELLRVLAAQEPAVIGLDMWRDIPVPKSGVYLAELNAVLQAHPNIIGIFTLGGIKPPKTLANIPERLGFNDNFPVDWEVDGTIPKVRRTMLTGRDVTEQLFDALPLRLALVYLERHGIEVQPDPDPDVLRVGKARLRPLRPNDGAYVEADVAGWQMLLDFKCPNLFTRYSVRDALSGRIPPGSLRGKIVVIGMNTPSVLDQQVTPISREHLGIEMQAATTHQILRHALTGERGLRFWPDWLEDGWILLWCLAGGALGYSVRSPWRFGSLALVGLLLLAGVAWGCFRLGWWIPLVSPAVAYVPAAALVISYISHQEEKQRGQLMQLFSRQVSPDVAQALWEQRDEFLAGIRPRSQKLTATILFTDLEGFSATSERLEPAVLMDWLNEYMDAMATVIMAHQGVVEKYIGDAIMAVFGVPIARTTPAEIERDARHAVRCALVMRIKMAELNARWTERGLPACRTRVGIHTGSLVAGSLGSADRQEYTVLGDAVNTASRLESFDKDWADADLAENACRILISEATLQLLGDEFETKRVGKMPLKNKLEPVTIYSVTGATNQARSPSHERPNQALL